jgi:deazaflavin-dependent oxidoreductase (nitroreductase family)
MTTTQTPIQAGRPRWSTPIHWIARPLGPLALPVAGRRWFPFWAILHHTGRRSGAAYATPVVSLPTPDGFLIPLPFGDRTQWAKNLFAAGGGRLRRAGRDVPVIDPEIVEREAVGPYLPALVRFLRRQLGLRQFVRVRRVG